MKSKIITCSLVVALSAIFITSCKKENKVDKPGTPIAKTIEKRTLNATEVALKQKLEQTSKIVAEVFQDKSLRKEFNEIVRKKVTEVNVESITFKELFSANSTDLELKNLLTKVFLKGL